MHPHKIQTALKRHRNDHQLFGRSTMILWRMLFFIQALTIIPGHIVMVSANPLKRLFMMRRMKDGEQQTQKRSQDRQSPKGSTATQLPRGGRVVAESEMMMRNIPEQVSDYLGNDIYTTYTQKPNQSPSGSPLSPVADEAPAIIETRTTAPQEAASVEEEQQAPSQQGHEPSNAAHDKGVCVNPREFEQVQEQLEEAKEGQSKLQRQHELYRQESESRLENLTKANESAFKVAQVQEDFAERIIKMQNKVEANLEAAKAAIAAKEEELEAYKEEMKQTELRLKAEMEGKIAQAKKDWKKQLSDVQADLNAGNEKIRAEYEGRLKQAEEEKAILKGEKKLLTENNEKLERKYENMLRDQEIALKAYLEVNLENEANKKKEAFRESLIAELEAIKSSSEATISHLASEMETLNATSIASIQELQSKYDTLKATSDKKIEQLSSDYTALQQSSQAKIEEIARNSENALADLRKQSADDLEQALASMESSHEEAMSKLSSQISSLQNERKGLVTTIKTNVEKLKTTEEKYEQAARDAEYWEEKFVKRPYVNLTHITTDASAYASDATAPVVQSTRSLYDSHVAPAASKSRELYDNHVRSTIDMAADVVNPVYKTHVEPHLESAKVTVSETSKSAFDGLKNRYEMACPSAMASLRDVEKSTGILLPDSIMESTRYSCQHADESVTAFLKVTVIIFAIFFRRPLWRLVVGTFVMAFNYIYYIAVAPWKLAFGVKVKRDAQNGGYISGTGGTPPKKPKHWKTA